MKTPFFFRFSKGETNRHGTQKKGQPWNQETVKGPRFSRIIKLERKSPGFSRRVIFYFPSGACWYFDVYSKLKAQ